MADEERPPFGRDARTHDELRAAFKAHQSGHIQVMSDGLATAPDNLATDMVRKLIKGLLYASPDGLRWPFAGSASATLTETHGDYTLTYTVTIHP